MANTGGPAEHLDDTIPLLEEILSGWRETLGSEYQGYRNHVCRMVHYCFALRACTQEEQEKIIIAGAFHDLGIWIADTVDYIPPSLPPAREYLEQRKLGAWTDEITLMITEHHKVREYTGAQAALVELFRKGDLVDVSLGVVRFGLSRAYITAVRTRFPNAAFHRNLGKRAARWFLRHPLNPAPMMKW